MNREIKFRAWEKKQKFMMAVENVDFEGGIVNKYGVWRFFEELEMMQYTGVKDKNGKEIYEGDVVKSENHYKAPCEIKVGFIAYDKELARYSLKSNDSWFASSISESDDRVSKIKYEIIGNIHENPELLKGGITC